MFESIVVRGLEKKGGTIDVGLLAEILLFYQNAHLLLDWGSLGSLLRAINADNFFYLLDNNFIRTTYFRQSLGTHSDSTTGLTVHDFIAFEMIGNRERGKFKNKEEIIIELFERALGKSRHARQLAKRFLSVSPIKKLSPGYGHSKGIPGLAREDLDDEIYVMSAIETALSELVPEFSRPARWYFRVIKIAKGFVVDTDLDFEKINVEYHKTVSPKHSTITAAFLLSHLLQARADLCLSSNYNSGFVASSISSTIIRAKLGDLLGRRFDNFRDIEVFQDLLLGSVHAIRDAIDCGERTFDDFIPILEKSAKFKEWLRGVHPDVGLLAEYHRASMAGTWVDKLPTKTVRFVCFTGLGLAIDAAVPTGLGTATGIALGAADTFVIDKLLKGWKPHQFIDDHLSEFVDTL